MPHPRSSRSRRPDGTASSEPASPDERLVRERQARAARTVAVLVALQGIGLVAAGLFLMIRALFPDAHNRGPTEVLGVLSLLVGVGVALMARAVARRRRQPALIVLEIICLPVAVSALQQGNWYVGIPLAVVAIAVLALLASAGLLLPEREQEG